ncbi:MAG: hydrogenase 3 maturation endopeptidase HyCI [candidate division WOR-3 bacterium]
MSLNSEPRIQHLEHRARSVLLGVGNRLRGDDAVGSLVAEELSGAEGLAVFDCGTTPENFIEPVVRLGPERILIVDACAFGGRPGEFKLFEQEEIEPLASGLVSTHTLPLTMTVALLCQQLTAGIQLLGVQPACIRFGARMSSAVAKAMPRLVQFVKVWTARSL